MSREPNSESEWRNREGCPLGHIPLLTTCAVQREKGRFPLDRGGGFHLQPVRDSHLQPPAANEKAPPLWILIFFPNELFFKTTLPTSSFLSIKRCSPPLLPRLACCSPSFACSWLRFLRYSLINSILLAESLTFFSRKVDKHTLSHLVLSATFKVYSISSLSLIEKLRLSVYTVRFESDSEWLPESLEEL